ncbi:MAG: Gfo/Idh/MocA family oxidoreductase [Rhodothermales bacterium]
MQPERTLNRRQFITAATAASAAFSIVPSYVRGAPNRIAPSDKINVALVGSGTQAFSMLMSTWLKNDNLQFVALADPNKDSDDYRDWSQNGLRDRVRKFLDEPRWGSEKGVRAGREAGREIIDTYYKKVRGMNDFKGVRTYEDFRELLDKEDGIDAVICMTPEHLHATVTIAAMNHGKHAITHKTLSNALHEVRLAADTARRTGLVTHQMAYQNDADWYNLKRWLDAGVIGKVKEVHNWTNRPVWPQGWMDYLPEQKIPKGLNWALWQGPVPDRPYNLNYTHALFRGWWDYGSGCLGDMGNYSLWRIYRMLNPGPPITVEGHSSSGAVIVGNQSQWRRSEVAFPNGGTVHFRHQDLDVYWYEGGITPRMPEEMYDAGMEFTREGMMLVGEYGKILGDYHCRKFTLLPESRMKAMAGVFPQEEMEVLDGTEEWVAAIREGRESAGSFQNVQQLAESTCLGNIALRMSRRIQWDPARMEITNIPEANKLLRREYRPGWELAAPDASASMGG